MNRAQRVGPAPRVRHGLSPDEVAAMTVRQGGKCLVCRIRPAEVIDHDHALAAAHGHAVAEGCRRCVRGILCDPCNRMLGAARDDPATLRAAAVYLELARGRG